MLRAKEEKQRKSEQLKTVPGTARKQPYQITVFSQISFLLLIF